jgi:pantetheine-phosphate adenylyltransferase
MKKAIFPGSFDPFTKGHYDIVMRSLPLFDEIVVAIGQNVSKTRYFPIEHIREKISASFAGELKISVETFYGLTAEFAKSVQAQYIIRGLRNTTDFEYENTIAQANKHVSPGLETVFLITSPHLAYISSTIVRELHKFGANVDEFLPYKL